MSIGTEQCAVVILLVVCLMISLMKLRFRSGSVWGGWLARHNTSIRWARLIARTFKYGQRAVRSGVLVGVLLGVLELEAAVEVVQSWEGRGGGDWLGH